MVCAALGKGSIKKGEVTFAYMVESRCLGREAADVFPSLFAF